MYRQGDLLIVKANSVTPLFKRLQSNVVQLGEATGHAHVLERGEVYGPSQNEAEFLRSDGSALLVHDEHEAIELPEGTYRVLRQREHLGDGQWSNVSD